MKIDGCFFVTFSFAKAIVIMNSNKTHWGVKDVRKIQAGSDCHFFVVNILLVYKLGKKWAATQAFCADMVRQIGLMKTVIVIGFVYSAGVLLLTGLTLGYSGVRRWLRKNR